jgi:hypothetical protein
MTGILCPAWVAEPLDQCPGYNFWFFGDFGRPPSLETHS